MNRLKEQYDKLSPFERAVRTIEAAARHDEATMDALEPLTLWSACHKASTLGAFAIISFMATASSLQAEARAWAGRGLLLIEANKGKKADEAEIEKGLTCLHELERKHLAWMLALEALDKETGGACTTLANLFAEGHAVETLEAAKGKDVCFAGELEYLRDAWQKITSRIAGAPKLENMPDAPQQ